MGGLRGNAKVGITASAALTLVSGSSQPPEKTVGRVLELGF